MAFTEFFVTKGANASNLNGGGPNIDTGNGDGPIDTTANATATHIGAGEHTIVDNVGGFFDSAAVGDWICWDTGGAKELAIITVVTDPTNITVQTPDTTEFSALLNKAVNVGGAWATIDFALSTITTDFVNAVSDLPRINVKGGAYPELATIANAGTDVVPITLEGYKTAVGDGGTEAFADLPIMDGGDIAGVGIHSTGRFWIIKNFSVLNSTGVGFINGAGIDNIFLYHIKVDNCTTGILGDDTIFVINSEITNNDNIGLNCDSNCILFGSLIAGNGDWGVQMQSTSIVGNIFYDNSTGSIRFQTFGLVAYNIIDGVLDANPASIGISCPDPTPNGVLTAHNIIHDCDLAFSAGTLSAINLSMYNLFGNIDTSPAFTNWILGDGDEEDPAGFPGFTGEGASNYQPTASSPANGAAGPVAIGSTTIGRAVGAAEPATVVGGGAAGHATLTGGMQ